METLKKKLKEAQALADKAEAQGDKGVAKLARAAVELYEQRIKDKEADK